MRRLTIIFLICAGSLEATTIVTSGAQSWSVLGATSNDTVVVASGSTLTLDINQATPSALGVFVRSGGLLTSTGGHRINVGALWLGGLSAAPFSSSSGGTLRLRSSDTIGIANRSLWGNADFNIGENATVDFNGGSTATRAVILGTDIATYGFPQIVCANTTAQFNADYTAFRRFQGTWPSGGLTFNSSGRTFDKQRIRHSLFDSASVAALSMSGFSIVKCSLLTSYGLNRAVSLFGGSCDSIIGCFIQSDNQHHPTVGAQGIYVAADSCLILGCHIQSISNNGGEGQGDFAINLEQNHAFSKIIADTVDGFEFSVGTPGGNHPNVLIANSRIQNGGHESVILHDGDTNWTIQNNLITSFSSGGRSSVTVYCSQTDGARSLKLFYNTIVATFGGSPASAPVAFENTGSGTITYNNIKMVGNLLVGDNVGFNRAEIILGTTATQSVTVNFSEFKHNAFDSVYYYGTSSASYPYNRLDSNLHNATSFLFIDSTAGDFRLGQNSPMKNAADSNFGCLVYGQHRAASAPFNIGCDQNFYNRWTHAKRSWINTACIDYSISPQIDSAQNFIGRTFDLVINPTESHATVIRAADSMTKIISYVTLSTIRPAVNDTGSIRVFANRIGVPVDSFWLWRDGTTVPDTLFGDCGGGTTCPCYAVRDTLGPNDTITFCDWNESKRRAVDFRRPYIADWLTGKTLSETGTIYDGIFEDEPGMYNSPVYSDVRFMIYPFSSSSFAPATGYSHVRGWSGLTRAQIRDSLTALKQHGWLKHLEDSLALYQLGHFRNVTNYATIGTANNRGDGIFDALATGCGLVVYENACSPYVTGPTWNHEAWSIMDSLASWDTSRAVIWTLIMPSESLAVATSGGWRRLQLERLVWYYLAASPRTYFLLSSNQQSNLSLPLTANSFVVADSSYKWCRAVNVDIGQPNAPRFVANTGIDPAGQSYTLYRRNFGNAILLYREASGANYSSASAISYTLPQVCAPVNPDGSLGVASSSASIRNMEGQIWLTNTPGDTINPAAPTAHPFRKWKRS